MYVLRGAWRLRCDRFAQGCGQSAGQRGGRGDADLLAENGANGQLEAVPGARYAQAGALRYACGEQWIGGQVGVDGGDVGIEVEQPAQPCDHAAQCGDAAAVDGRQQVMGLWRVAHFKHTLGTIQGKASAIALVVDRFHPGDCAQAQEIEHGRPVVGWAERQLQRHAGGVVTLGPQAAAQLAGRASVGLLHGGVETAHTAESGRHGDVGHVQ
ncbi:MAG: hypothetical protein P8015_07335 [Acidihalobacter sp.]